MTPVTYDTIVKLKDLGLNPSYFKFSAVSMESTRHICIKDVSPDGTQRMGIVDLETSKLIKTSMKGYSAVLNPTHFIVCIIGDDDGLPGDYIQILNLNQKILLSDYKFDESVVYWKWLSAEDIAIVTLSSVYHWHINTQTPFETPPKKIFDRAGKFKESNIQIIGYKYDPVRRWSLLSAISSGEHTKSVNGHMMLYTVDKDQHQILSGHAGVFGRIKSKTGETIPVLAFIETKTSSVSKLHVTSYFSQSFKMSAEFEEVSKSSDFPVSIVILEKLGALAVVTRNGFIYFYDAIYLNRIAVIRVCTDCVFTVTLNTQPSDTTNIFDDFSQSFNLVNSAGHVIKVNIHGRELIQYLRNPNSFASIVTLDHSNFLDISTSLMLIYGLPGDEIEMKQIFKDLFQKGEYKRAATIACSVPSLRSVETIQMFKQAKSAPGTPQPLLQYFTVLLDNSKLDEYETCELFKPAIAQNKIDLIERWLNVKNITPSLNLGNMIKPINPKLAINAFLASHAYEEAINTMIETGDLKSLELLLQNNVQNGEILFKGNIALRNVFTFTSKNSPNVLTEILQMLNRKDSFKNAFVSEDPFALLINFGHLKEVTTFLLDFLKENNPIHSNLQTLVLAENLKKAPSVAEYIFNESLYTHFDRSLIGTLAESVGLFHIAIKCFNSVEKLQSIILCNPSLLTNELLAEIIAKMSIEESVAIIEFILKNKVLQCSQAIKAINVPSIPVSDLYRLSMLIEDYGSQQDLYYILNKYVQFPGTKYVPNPSLELLRESELHFKLIAAAVSIGDMSRVEFICKTSISINPEKVKTFFKGIDQFKSDPRAFIYIADRFSYFDELASLLVDCDPRFMQAYLLKINKEAAPHIAKSIVTDETIAIDSDKVCELFKSIDDNQLEAVSLKFSENELVPEVFYKFLSTRIDKLNYDPNKFINTFTLFAKISIKKGLGEQFFNKYTHYNKEEVAKYSRDSYPEYAFTAYKSDPNATHLLIDLSFNKKLYSQLASHLFESQNLKLWSEVLAHPDFDHVITEIISNQLTHFTNSQQILVAIKALMDAKLNKQLILFLDKIILSKTQLSDNRNLQNLLLVTALNERSDNLEKYINACTNCDVDHVAKLALDLNEVDHALNIYIKSGNPAEAVRVLLDKGDLDGASKLADQVDDRLVYGFVAQSFLATDITRALDYFIKSGDSSYYSMIVDKCKERKDYKNLIRYLTSSFDDGEKHKSYHSISRNTDLAYAYAFSGDTDSLKSFISQNSDSINLNSVGDAIFPESPAIAKILFEASKNYYSLSRCHLQLKEYKEAVSTSILSPLPQIKLDVAVKCLENDFLDDASLLIRELAEHPILLNELCAKYEKLGFHHQLLHKLSFYVHTDEDFAGKNNLATIMATYLVSYAPKLAFDFIKRFKDLLAGDKIANVCEKYYMFKEAAYVYSIILNDYDRSARIMIDHFGLAWEHSVVLGFINRLSSKIVEDFILFYLENFPHLLHEVLAHLGDKLDLNHLVNNARRLDLIWLIKDYLEKIQYVNLISVNDALNDYYIKKCDYVMLEKSIKNYDSFDCNYVLKNIKSHEMNQMKAVAAIIYYMNKSYKQCLQISLETENYKLALLAASQTDGPITHQLLYYFSTKSLYSEFIACCCICFNLIDPTLVLELLFEKEDSDKNDMYSIVMPFFIQTLSIMQDKLSKLKLS